MTELLSNATKELYRSTIMSWVEDPGTEEFEGLDMRKLDIDQAYVVAATTVDPVGLYSVSDDCYRCPYQLVQAIGSNTTEPLTLSTAFGVSWRVFSSAAEQFISTKNRSGLICELRPDLGEFGVYHLNVTSSDCDFTTAKEPVDIHLPLALAAMVLGGAGAACAAVGSLISLARRTGKLRYGDAELVAPQRQRAIDTLRGLAIVMMVFVNFGGGYYQRWMAHATWNGLNVSDLVFPTFVWVMGVCIPLNVKSALSKGVPRRKALAGILRRSCLMFLLGVSLNTIAGRNMLGTIRVMGVLQRLGLSYLVVASYCLFTTKKYFTHPRGACGQALKDVWATAWCWLLAVAVLALHTFVTLQVHDPDCPPGYLGPGGRHDNWAVAAACAGGATGYVDKLILGKGHIYQILGIVHVYGAESMDPENLLGVLTTIVHVVLGVQAGATMVHYKSTGARVARWLAWAMLLALIGAILAGFSKEKGIVPINKNLWSISFVLVTSAISGTLLSAFYILTDALRVWGGAPFCAPGRNAIFIYFGHSVCFHMFPFRWRVDGMRTHAIFLLENLWGTAMWVAVGHYMVWKKIFLTL